MMNKKVNIFIRWYHLVRYHWHFAKAYYYGKERHFKKLALFEQKINQWKIENQEDEADQEGNRLLSFNHWLWKRKEPSISTSKKR